MFYVGKTGSTTYGLRPHIEIHFYIFLSTYALTHVKKECLLLNSFDYGIKTRLR